MHATGFTFTVNLSSFMPKMVSCASVNPNPARMQCRLHLDPPTPTPIAREGQKPGPVSHSTSVSSICLHPPAKLLISVTFGGVLISSCAQLKGFKELRFLI